MIQRWIGLRNIICLLLFVLSLDSCSSPSEKTVPEPAVPEEPKHPIHTVKMIQMKFFPAELRVKKGDKIVFVNHDLVTHDVTEESKKAWSSSPLTIDQSWVLIATESSNYYCSIHPVMKGKIVVEQ